MSRRTSTARYTLPLDVAPPTTVDFCVRVPNDIYHIGAFMGQIYALSRAYSWADDAAHTALLAAAVWREIFDGLQPGSCAVAQLAAGADEGVEQLIRQNPDNPCLLETSINGTDWCAFADLSKCVPAGAQPGSGSGLPSAGGGSQCYDARMQASSKWLMPYQVNTGDVITISLANGATSDGSGAWFCPNGQRFFLAACTGTASTSGSDPAPAIPHMRLIAKIGAAYYDAYNTSISVPSGVSFADVEFQINDPSLSDNYGELTFRVCVQNNGAAVWTHTFDFTLSDGGFVVDTPNGGGAYIPGTGWKTNNSSLNSFSIKRTGLATYDLTQAEWHVTLDTPQAGAQLYTYGDGTHALPAIPYSGTGAQTKITTGSYAFSGGTFFLGMDGTADSLGRHQIVTKVTLTGTGVDPFA